MKRRFTVKASTSTKRRKTRVLSVTRHHSNRFPDFYDEYDVDSIEDVVSAPLERVYGILIVNDMTDVDTIITSPDKGPLKKISSDIRNYIKDFDGDDEFELDLDQYRDGFILIFNSEDSSITMDSMTGELIIDDGFNGDRFYSVEVIDDIRLRF